MKSQLFLVFVFLSNIIIAQESFHMKFSDIPMEDIKMSNCSFDSSANAVILGEVETLWLDLNSKGQIEYRVEVHRRIKILTLDGKNFASIKIPYIKGRLNSNTEVINNFKAATYNLENGKIKKTNLQKIDKFNNDINEFRGEISFVMPNVKLGSIIEYKYIISSVFIGSLRTKYLQADIPIRDFKYSYTIPNFILYNIGMLGNLDKYDFNNTVEGLRMGNSYQDGKNTTIIGHHVLPYESEPYMTSFRSVVPRIEFSMVKFQSAYNIHKDYGTTYEKMNKLLLQSQNYGSPMKKGKFVKKWTNEIKGMSKLEKSKFILSKIQDEIAWNGSYSTYSRSSGKSLLKKGKGSLGELNIAYIAALRYLDIEAYPVISYTRKYGIPHPVYPSRYKFNYITTLVIIDNEEFLCDPSLSIPFGMIRPEAINYKGWLVSEKGRWIDLTRNSEANTSSMVSVRTEKNKLLSIVKLLFKDYAAYEKYNEFINDQNSFEDQLKLLFPSWNITHIDYGKQNSKYMFTIDLRLEKELIDRDLIFIKPLLLSNFMEPPFIREDRLSNIDFNYKYNNNSFFELIIPEGYKVESPDNSRIRTEDSSITFSYMVSQSPKKITINSKTKFTKNSFSSTEYSGLKSIIDSMVKHNSQSISLKKI